MNIIKKLFFLIWDKDFTKLTPSEAKILAQTDNEISCGEFVVDSEELWR